MVVTPDVSGCPNVRACTGASLEKERKKEKRKQEHDTKKQQKAREENEGEEQENKNEPNQRSILLGEKGRPENGTILNGNTTNAH